MAVQEAEGSRTLVPTEAASQTLRQEAPPVLRCRLAGAAACPLQPSIRLLCRWALRTRLPCGRSRAAEGQAVGWSSGEAGPAQHLNSALVLSRPADPPPQRRVTRCSGSCPTACAAAQAELLRSCPADQHGLPWIARCRPVRASDGAGRAVAPALGAQAGVAGWLPPR